MENTDLFGLVPQSKTPVTTFWFAPQHELLVEACVADSNHLITRPIGNGWEFVNLFYDRREATFYCRIQKIDPGITLGGWDNISRSGATMQIAYDRAIEAALKR